MADVILFHSVLGVRRGVTDAAERIEAMGHTVHVPNLYGEGVVFDEYEPAMAYVESIGSYPALMQRTREAVAGLPDETVYAGFSNGGGSAEYLALTRPGARGTLLFAAGISLKWFAEPGGSPPSWPSTVPVQVHYTVADPFREQAELDAFAASVSAAGARFTLHEYAGDGHLFTDPTLPREYDPAATELLWKHVAAFLDHV
jgi:dienelactone hydrolase